MTTASGKPLIIDRPELYDIYDPDWIPTPELCAVAQHPGFEGVSLYDFFHEVRRHDRRLCSCKRKVGARARIVIGDRLVSIRKEPEGWVLVRHVKRPVVAA